MGSEIRKEGFEERIREELELIREEVAFNLKEELFQIGITEVTN